MTCPSKFSVVSNSKLLSDKIRSREGLYAKVPTILGVIYMYHIFISGNFLIVGGRTRSFTNLYFYASSFWMVEVSYLLVTSYFPLRKVLGRFKAVKF